MSKGGATACEASAAFFNSTRFLRAVLPLFATHTLASGSRLPKADSPLKRLLARPSQKLRKLNAALITVGALRLVAWRTCKAPM